MNDSSAPLKSQTAGAAALPGSLLPAERKRMHQRFEQAIRLMDQAGYDAGRVHELLAECVMQEPGNAAFVAALLRNLRQTSRGMGSVPVPLSSNLAEQLANSADEQDWAGVFKLGPAAMLSAPHDMTVLERLAQASQACEYFESAALYTGRALESAPEKIELHRQAARIFSSLGQIEEALSHWQRVERADPRDDEAPRMISVLTLERIRRPAREDASDADSSVEPPLPNSPVLPKAPAVKMPEMRAAEKPKTLVLTPRQRLEKTIADNPEDETGYLKLADFHLAEDRLFEAQRTLTRALSVAPELHIREKLEDVNILRARQQAQMARQRAAEERTVEAVELAEKLETELQQLEFDIVRARCDRYPDNKSLRFQLGMCWKRRGDLRQALEPLQAGLEVPECRAAASLEIGEILQRYKQFPKALQCYRQSAQLAVQEPLDEESRKSALYRAGVLAAQMKLNDSAKHYLGELVKTAPDYKDARSRLDKLNEIDETD
jgi:tetratricopeptide (TPR) repeat protein